MPSFYGKHLTKTLAAAVAEQLEAAPHEQINLYEELALSRESVGQIVKLYGIAEAAGNVEAITGAGVMMRDALKDVQGLCEAASRINTATKEKFDIHNVAHIVAQIVRIAYDVFGDEHLDLAKEFERKVKGGIKLADSSEGVTETPDELARQMAATTAGKA